MRLQRGRGFDLQRTSPASETFTGDKPRKIFWKTRHGGRFGSCLTLILINFRTIEPFLSNEISRCVLGEDEISDDASSTLKHIRKSIQLLNERVHSTLTSLATAR